MAFKLTDEQRAEISVRCRQGRIAQGLPPKITDPEVLGRIADIAAGARERREAAEREAERSVAS